MSYARKSGINNLSHSTRPLLKRPKLSEVRPPKFIAVYRSNEGELLKVPTVIGFRGPNLEDAQKALDKMIRNGQIIQRYRNGIKVMEKSEYDKS